ncbi:MAG: AAA family ATPase [Candidatus Omnitrophota bacterium]
MTDERKIKEIPDDGSSFNRIREENRYFVDKTMFLSIIEEDTYPHVMMNRPRGFGKSLFTSMLETYYDILLKDQYDFFFNDTWIHLYPTPMRNSYLILNLNFAEINLDVDKVEKSLYHYILKRGELFISKYGKLLKIDENEEISKFQNLTSTHHAFNHLVGLVKRSGQKLYVIIDNYDHFANAAFAIKDREDYRKLNFIEELFCSFFKLLETGARGDDAPIDRLFFTGIFPINLMRPSGGFDIGYNISFHPLTRAMFGFSYIHMQEMLKYYRSVGYLKHEPDYLLEIMSKWYGNYRFVNHPDERSFFNPRMVLHFLREYFRTQSIPEDLMVPHMQPDYEKLKELMTGGFERVNRDSNQLKQMISDGHMLSDVGRGFSFANLTDSDNFLSILFYSGFITIKESVFYTPRLVSPNKITRAFLRKVLPKGE